MLLLHIQVIRAEWIDPIISQDVEKILGAAKTLDLWTPEKIELIHETRSIDFMIAQHEFDNISHLLRMNTVSGRLKMICIGRTPKLGVEHNLCALGRYELDWVRLIFHPFKSKQWLKTLEFLSKNNAFDLFKQLHLDQPEITLIQV